MSKDLENKKDKELQKELVKKELKEKVCISEYDYYEVSFQDGGMLNFFLHKELGLFVLRTLKDTQRTKDFIDLISGIDYCDLLELLEEVNKEKGVN